MWIDTKCLSSFFVYDSSVLLLTNRAGSALQIFTILLKKKCFASSYLKRLPMILSGVCEIGSYIVVYVNIIKTMVNYKYLN